MTTPKIKGLATEYDFERSLELSFFLEGLWLELVIRKNRLHVVRKGAIMPYHKKEIALYKFVSLFNKGAESKYMREICTPTQIRYMNAFRPHGATQKLHLQRKKKGR